jgi:hypothetical protein
MLRLGIKFDEEAGMGYLPKLRIFGATRTKGKAPSKWQLRVNLIVRDSTRHKIVRHPDGDTEENSLLDCLVKIFPEEIEVLTQFLAANCREACAYLPPYDSIVHLQLRTVDVVNYSIPSTDQCRTPRRAVAPDHIYEASSLLARHLAQELRCVLLKFGIIFDLHETDASPIEQEIRDRLRDVLLPDKMVESCSCFAKEILEKPV